MLFRSIRYDPENKPGVSNLLTIIHGFTGEPIHAIVDSLQGQMYGELKKRAAEAVLAYAEPFQAKVHALLDDRAELENVMAKGAAKASTAAEHTLHAVYAAIGFVPASGR